MFKSEGAKVRQYIGPSCYPVYEDADGNLLLYCESKCASGKVHLARKVLSAFLEIPRRGEPYVTFRNLLGGLDNTSLVVKRSSGVSCYRLPRDENDDLVASVANLEAADVRR